MYHSIHGAGELQDVVFADFPEPVGGERVEVLVGGRRRLVVVGGGHFSCELFAKFSSGWLTSS